MSQLLARFRRKSVRPSNGEPSFLFVHPNCELYGSDRQLIKSVTAVRARWPEASLTVVLPEEGVLADLLRDTGIDVETELLFVPRLADLVGTATMLPRIVARVAAARRRMSGYDLVYINTMMPLDYLIASRLRPGARLIHIHELPTGPRRAVFARVLAFARGRFVFISDAVRDDFPELRGRRSEVIWNGTRDFAVEPASAVGPLRLLLIGRFNGWKGQGVLLGALALLSDKERAGLRVRMVGSTFKGAEHHEARIRSMIAEHGLEDCVEMHGFDPTPDLHYQWAEAVVVPSTKPEPFGLVSIEAMASGRAVIASDQGGLVEIVVDGETGTRFRPEDPQALADVIRRYLADRSLAGRHGTAGRVRYDREFRDDIYGDRIVAAVTRTLADADPVAT